jgi:hypothetical protein
LLLAPHTYSEVKPKQMRQNKAYMSELALNFLANAQQKQQHGHHAYQSLLCVIMVSKKI